MEGIGGLRCQFHVHFLGVRLAIRTGEDPRQRDGRVPLGLQDVPFTVSAPTCHEAANQSSVKVIA
jgi:hypothetical protein